MSDEPPSASPLSSPPVATLVWAKMGKWPWWPGNVQAAPLNVAVPGGAPSCWIRFCSTHDGGYVRCSRVRLWVAWEQPETSKIRQMQASYDAALEEARGVASGEGAEMEQVMQVKRLKAQRISPCGQRQFLVQWFQEGGGLGTSKNDLYADTWEDADHILDPQLVQDLEDREEQERDPAEPTDGSEPARKRTRCRECEGCVRPPCGALGLVRRSPLPRAALRVPGWLHSLSYNVPHYSPLCETRSIAAAPNVAPVALAGECHHCQVPALRQACKLRVCTQMSATRPAEQPPAKPQYPIVRIKMRGMDSMPPPSSSPPPPPLWQPASSSASPDEGEELPSWALWGKEEDANATDASHATKAAADGHGSSCRYCALVIGPRGNLRQHEERCLAQHQAVEAARASCAACGGNQREHTCVAIDSPRAERPSVAAVAVEEEQLPLQFSSRSTTGYRGVYKRGDRFRVQIYPSSGHHATDLGLYATAVKAAEVYARAAASAHTGEGAGSSNSDRGSPGAVEAEDAPTPSRARSRKRPLDASSSRMPPPSHAASADAPTLEDAPMPPSPPSWPAAGEASDPISQARGELVEALCKLQSRCVRHPRSVPSAASGEDTMVQPHQTIYVLTPHTESGFWMGPLGWDLGARRPPGMGLPGVGYLVSI